jgi:hypothetical protein
LIISIVDNGGKLPQKSLKRSPATRVQDLCRALKIKEGILPAIAVVWDRHEARKPSRNEFEAAIYTVFDDLEPEQHKGMSVAFEGYSKLRSDRTAECFFDDRLADKVRGRAFEEADFIRQFMHEGMEFTAKQLYPGSDGIPGPGQVRLWKKPVDTEGPADLGPWPWLTAIRTDPASTNEFGNLESFIPVPPQTGQVRPLGYQFAQECRFEPDASGGINARCDRVHPTGGGPLAPVPCPGGSSYTFGNDCLRIPSQRGAGSIRLRGFNFITPSVKVHLQSQDHPLLPPIPQECIVYGDRETPANDEQGKVIADFRVRDWVDVPIPKEHPERPGTPLAPGLYEISITVSEPSATGAPVVRNSNKLLLRIEPNENVHFLLRSESGKCIEESDGPGNDEIWWDAFVGHIVADKVPLDTEQATGVQIKDISRRPFPRAPWEDMFKGKPATYVCDIFGPGPFGLNGVVAVAIVGFEIDSESAARDQLQGFWNAYFEALKSIAEVALSAVGLGVSLAGLIGGPVALAAAAVIAGYIAALTLVALGFWAVWAPADLIALDIFAIDGMSAWDKTDATRPLPGESVREIRREFDDNSVLVRTTQRPLPRKPKNKDELVVTYVQENQYDAHHDGDLFARYALEFRLTRSKL